MFAKESIENIIREYIAAKKGVSVENISIMETTTSFYPNIEGFKYKFEAFQGRQSVVLAPTMDDELEALMQLAFRAGDYL